MGQFKNGQVVFIKNCSTLSYLIGARAKVILTYSMNTGTKRKPRYVEMAYLNTTWVGLERGRRGYVKEIVLPTSSIMAIPSGYAPVIGRLIIRSGDKFWNGYRIEEVDFSGGGRVANQLHRLYVRKKVVVAVAKKAVKKTATKKVAAKKATRRAR